ncbi:hypothetical protein SRHO_G00098950 [Serrasalmus rhombeus]
MPGRSSRLHQQMNTSATGVSGVPLNATRCKKGRMARMRNLKMDVENDKQGEFIEEILAPPFGGMITFVKESEALMEKGQLDKLKNDEVRITQLVRGFSSTWKQPVKALSQDALFHQL